MINGGPSSRQMAIVRIGLGMRALSTMQIHLICGVLMLSRLQQKRAPVLAVF